ncbi:MAG: AEC family transporter [Propioniciclava sp.]
MEVLGQAAVIVAIILLGQVLKRIGWLTSRDFTPLSVIAVRVTLPCAVITNFDAFEIGPELLWFTLFGFLVIVAGQLATVLVERRRGRAAQAFGVLNVSNFNIGLFVIPYLSAVMGPQAIVVASMFDIGNAIGAAGLGYAGGMALASGERPSGRRFLRSVFSSPVFLAYVGMLVLGLADISLPSGIVAFTATIGGANTFIAMLMIGVGLELALDRGALAEATRYLATRWAVLAAATAVLWLVLPFSVADKATLTMVIAAPMAAMVSGFTDEAGLDVRVSTFMTTVTVAVALVAMPAVLVLAA